MSAEDPDSDEHTYIAEQVVNTSILPDIVTAYGFLSDSDTAKVPTSEEEDPEVFEHEARSARGQEGAGRGERG